MPWLIYCQDTLILFIESDEVYIGRPSLYDDFSGSNLDQSRWYGYYPWGGLSLDAKTYTDPSLCNQSNGLLRLSVDTVSAWRVFPNWMIDAKKIESNPSLMRNGHLEINRLTSAIWSKRQFRFGYFEAKCYLPKGKGYWPAFWLYGGNPNEEIDIMEAKGERKASYHVDIHCPNRCDRIKQLGLIDKPFGHWVSTQEHISESWVTFSGLWTPEGIWFYFNDRLVAQHKASFKTSMNLIANFSLAMDNGPFSPGPNRKTEFPAEYLIDYIRAWEIPALMDGPLKYKEIKEASFIKVIPTAAKEVTFESSPQVNSKCRLFIEKEVQESGKDRDFIPVLELDLTARIQHIDYTFWSPGSYYLRVLNGQRITQIPFIKLD